MNRFIIQMGSWLPIYQIGNTKEFFIIIYFSKKTSYVHICKYITCSMYYKNRHNKHVDYHKSETNKYGTRQVLQIDMLYFINTVFCIVHSKLQKYQRAWNIKSTMFGDSSFQRMNKKKSFFMWISTCAIIFTTYWIFLPTIFCPPL